MYNMTMGLLCTDDIILIILWSRNRIHANINNIILDRIKIMHNGVGAGISNRTRYDFLKKKIMINACHFQIERSAKL